MFTRGLFVDFFLKAVKTFKAKIKRIKPYNNLIIRCLSALLDW
jgi:hypothetical protein